MNLVKSCLLVVPAIVIVASVAWVQPAVSDSAKAPRNIGGMTLDQFLARQTPRIMAADTDGDGRISRAEMETMTVKGKRDPSRRFDAMDTNHDGYLDKGEIQAALTKRFEKMDLNGDGVVTPDERMAFRARHQQHEPASMSAGASRP